MNGNLMQRKEAMTIISEYLDHDCLDILFRALIGGQLIIWGLLDIILMEVL